VGAGDFGPDSLRFKYNKYIVANGFKDATRRPEGPERTAAIAAWIQSLYSARPPVLTGGAAVELYTAGAYTTGDFDFIGDVTKEVAARLADAGFRREGRHWIHPKEQLFIEFPGSAVQSHERAAVVQVGRFSVLALSPEDMIVDRLAAWQFWNSSTDGASAFLVWIAQANRLDKKRLESLADRRGVRAGWKRLVEFVEANAGRKPSAEDLETWASRKP
jgi:hypothetical protein